MIHPELEAGESDFLTQGGTRARFTPDPEKSLSNGHAASPPAEHHLVPLMVWLGVVVTLLVIPFRIISYGYLPPDDGLRHAAKAVSGREWSDVMVIQDQFKLDHNPGWHAVLGLVHRVTGADPEGLVVFALCTLALLVTFVPLGWLRFPEAWIGTLLVAQLAFANMTYRIFLGRPFAVSIAATTAILFLWRGHKDKKPTVGMLAITTILFALGTWIHGSWYLFALVAAAFALAGHWRSALSLGGCWLTGAMLGALLTGHPLAFLWNAINIGINCFGHNQLQRMLVGEFMPSDGSYPTVFFIVLLLVLRGLSRRWDWKVVNNPIFMLVVIGWVLGLRVIRFWVDWALPALAVWTALELQGHLTRYLPPASLRRLAIAGGMCMALFFVTTSDLNGRWTNNLSKEPLSASDPEMAPWLPEDGGIIYSAQMGVFYDTFFKNPHAKWKYILGFESTFMPPDDLRILRNIQWNFYAAKAHEPWVAKMRPEDRMVILGGSSSPPALAGLEWKYVARDTWVGRLPRQNTFEKSAELQTLNELFPFAPSSPVDQTSLQP